MKRFNDLPSSIVDNIYEFSGNHWKTRFTNDVLPELNKGIRLVGFFDTLPDRDGQIDRYLCANCYQYGWEKAQEYAEDPDDCDHSRFTFASLNDFKRRHVDFIIYDNGPLVYIAQHMNYEQWSYLNSKVMKKNNRDCNGMDIIKEILKAIKKLNVQ